MCIAIKSTSEEVVATGYVHHTQLGRKATDTTSGQSVTATFSYSVESAAQAYMENALNPAVLHVTSLLLVAWWSVISKLHSGPTLCFCV